jgi:cyclohexanecarboxylate-CoA ligase
MTEATDAQRNGDAANAAGHFPVQGWSTEWELIERRVAATPDSPMMQDEEGRSLTFREFRDAAELVAARLAQLGVHAESRVSWQLPTSLETAVLCAALSRLGAVQNPIVPILREREVRFITAQTRAELFIVPSTYRKFDFATLAQKIAEDVGFEILVLDFSRRDGPFGLALPEADPSHLPPVPHVASGEEPAVRWIYYTSGTTADPKGARHTDRSMIAACAGNVVIGRTTSDDLFVTAGPMAHVGGVLWLNTQLITGCQRGLIDIFDAEKTPLAAARYNPTYLSAGISVIQAYRDAQRAHGSARLLPRLRMIVNGGAPRPPDLDEIVRRELGGVGVISSWGLTECPAPTMCPLDAPESVRAVSEGTPVPGATVVACDPSGRVCAPGVEGELRVKAPQMFQGYVDESLNAEAFDEEGRFHTGDLGLVDESGLVRVTGRLKDIIIRNAENISALEVENVLSLHPKVADVAVIGVPDPITGERCCAVVQLRAGETLTLGEVVDYCKSQGLSVQKIPERLEFVELIPRNDMAKLQKRPLRELFGAS